MQFLTKNIPLDFKLVSSFNLLQQNSLEKF